MPISLILTPFDHFQIRPTFAVTPNLILEPCLKTLALANIIELWQSFMRIGHIFGSALSLSLVSQLYKLGLLAI